MVMASPASSSSSILLLLDCLLLSLSLDAPAHAAAPSPFSFSFESFDLSEDLKFEHDAAVNGTLVDLTRIGEVPYYSEGRMSYAHPVPFYDTTTGEVASFHTQFKFAIKNFSIYKGDGMAFFLANYPPSKMPATATGGNLGLIANEKNTAFGADRFVAVEFDTFRSTWDPPFDHIGIDINSVRESANTTSLPRLLNGNMTATVTFDYNTRMMVATLQFDDDVSMKKFEVSTKLPDPTTLLPSDVAVGFSAATGANVELHQILSWSFSSTLAPRNKVHDTKEAIVGGSIVGPLALVMLVWCILSCFRWKSKSHALVMRTGGTRRFEYRDLAAATDNFSEQRELGRGSFGVVYRATLSDGEVAVKKILNESRGGNADFFAEIKTISEAKHKNLVKLKGWCHRENGWNILDFMCWCRKKKDDQFFLVYELVPKGNLDDHLHKREQVLPWPTRYRIVKDICSALVYLHQDCDPYILHRDIKPGNILLGDNFKAKLADFGLSRIANENNASLLTSAVGTERYLDPQCKKHGEVKFNRTSDVYSFGILLLDIACTGKSREQVWDLYTKSEVRGVKVMEAADPKLGGDLDGTQMVRVAVLGLWCSLHDSANRPTVQKAMNVLERDEPLPDLRHLWSICRHLHKSAGSSFIEQHIHGFWGRRSCMDCPTWLATIWLQLLIAFMLVWLYVFAFILVWLHI